jgi:hypothetical protein
VRANLTQPTTIDLHFPKAGVDVSQAYSRQPAREVMNGEYARTAPEAVNVRGIDPQAARTRGGTRPGLSKWIDARPAGVRWVVQELAVLTGTGYSPPGGGDVQGSNSGRVVTVVAVQQGNVYSASPGDTAWTAATNGSSETPPLNFTGIVFSAASGGKLYFADGTNYRLFDPATNTVSDWETSVPAAPLPVDSTGRTPRLICTWRGRTILSGILGSPQAVFGSKVDDPTNFDTSPSAGTGGPLATQAFALTVGKQGQVGDVVTCVYPYSDDVLFIGGSNSIHLLRGDPMAGGTRDLVTAEVGCAWGLPVCQDAEGRIWFFSNRTGLYTLVPGQAPRLVSWPIQSLARAVNTGDNAVRLAWDDRSRCVEVFVTPLAARGATTHFTFETQNGAWFKRTHADTGHDPLCVCTVDGNRPEDRAVLLGCWDGYVRKIDVDADSDDGTPIESEVWLGPLLTKEMDELRVDQLQAVLGEDSGDVTCTVHVGNTAEAAFESAGVPVGTLKAGRGLTLPVRRAGHAVYLKLTSTKRWTLEQVRVRLAPLGKVRRRGR